MQCNSIYVCICYSKHRMVAYIDDEEKLSVYRANE